MWGRLATCAAVDYRRRGAGPTCLSKHKAGGIGTRRTKGSALLMVLWICAALAAVAFSLANTVRGETGRTSTQLDEIRGYYLAAGAVDRAAVEVLWSAAYTEDRKIKQGSSFVDFQFPSGVAHVELIPETAKLNVNSIQPDRLARLIGALGGDPGVAMAITSAVVARRSGTGGEVSVSAGPTFPVAGASFQEIEELLSVRGVTPELFYGTYVPASGNPAAGQARLVRRSGLVDCLSVYGSTTQVDANTADAAVLAAVGIPDGGIQALLQQRRTMPLTPATLAQLQGSLGPAGSALRLEGNSILTIRATAQVRLPNGKLSDMRRTVAAQVKYTPSGFDAPIHVLRWYDSTWSN
jgi:general secretion pathway protein K